MRNFVDHLTKLNFFDLQEIGKCGRHGLGCAPGAAIEACQFGGPVHEDSLS